MSYYFPVYFKKMNSINDASKFIVSLKQHILKNKDKWGKEFKSVLYRYNISTDDEELAKFFGDSHIKLRAVTDIVDLFAAKVFYDKKMKIFGMIGCFPLCEKLFDGSFEFQNSCDQDYEFKSWAQLDALKPIVDKYKTMSAVDLKKKLKYIDNEDIEDKDDLNYYRRTACYEEIEKLFIGHTNVHLDNENNQFYISLFRSSDMSDYVVLCDMFRAALIAYKKETEEWKTAKK